VTIKGESIPFWMKTKRIKKELKRELKREKRVEGAFLASASIGTSESDDDRANDTKVRIAFESRSDKRMNTLD
jgi:hypothetical protein